MILSQQQQQRRENLPKTANLLACKQWWKSCFLHGDQEKFYRQIYSRAAAQRLAANYSSTEFPTKITRNDENDTFEIKQKIAINVQDDPFLFGINGADAKNVEGT
jgi:hypothetical protein